MPTCKEIANQPKMTIETMPDSVAELLEASASKEGGVAFRTSDPELLVDVISRRYLNPSASAFLASTPEEAAASVAPAGQFEAVLEGEEGFKIKISPSERLEGINLLVRAAANAKAAAEAAPQHSQELKGFAQNFTGAVGWLIEHIGLSPRAAVGVASGALFVEMATACAKPPDRVYLTPDNRPTVTAPLPSGPPAPSPEPTKAPEAASWDFSQKLPTLTSENAKFETSPDGSAKLTFTNQGKEYFVSVDKPPEMIDFEGNTIADGVIEAEFYKAVYKKDPLIRYTRGGDTLGWFDPNEEKWIPSYETLFKLDSYPPLPSWVRWINKDGGFVDYMTADDGSDYIDFAGQAKRLFTEKVRGPSGYKEKVWMEMTYGNKDSLVVVELFEKNGGQTEGISIPKSLSEYGGNWFVTDSITYSQDEVISALKESSYVQVFLIVEKSTAGYYASEKDQRMVDLQKKYGYETKTFLIALRSGNFEGVKNRLPIGYFCLWIFK